MSKLTHTCQKLLLLVLVGGFLSSAGAQTLRMSDPSAANDGRPTRGMSQSSVEAKYGAPASKRTPVGEPPITRWEYPNMIVYFEHDRVIHAVLKR